MSIRRREFLAGAAGLGLVASLPAQRAMANVAQQLEAYRGGQLVVTTWGGSTADAFREAYFKEFSATFGIEIIEDSPPKDARIKAMVDAGNVTIDIADKGTHAVHALGEAGLLEEIDYSVVDATGIPESSVGKYGVGNYSWTQLVAYRTDVYTNKQPDSVTALFDVENFPGLRGMRDDPVMNLVYALLADGVPASEVYPLTEEKIARAYAKLDTIKDNVLWWTSGAQTQQLLSTNEVSMIGMWNGRVDKLLEEGLPIGVTWNGSQFATDSWIVPKGAPNKEIAMLFIAWYSLAENNAKFSEYITYGPVNRDAFNNVSEARKSLIPSTYIDEMVIADYTYWGENYVEQAERWKEWRLS